MNEHSHPHRPGGRRFLLAICLNLGFSAGEAFYGVQAGSAALMADALHNLADVAGLMIAWGGAWFAARPATERFTYGLRSTTIYAAFVNASLLLLACGGLGWEAAQRLFAATPVDGELMGVVAAVGILVNGLSALLFWRDHGHDLNVHGAFVHLLADAAVSVGVCLAGFAIVRTGWNWLDPLVTLLIVAAILITTWQLLRDAALLGLHGVPRKIQIDEVAAALATEPDVETVHDLHIWALSTTDIALTAHLVMPRGHPGDSRLEAIASRMHAQFGIGHTTLQIEVSDNRHACALSTPPAH